MNIILNDNRAFHWYSQGNVIVKGYLFDKDNRFYSGSDLIDFYSLVITREEFIKKLQESNGIFSVIIKRERGLWAAVDCIRTFPLFYRNNKGEIIVTDSPDVFAGKKINIERIKEFLACGYVTGNQTMLRDVYQIQAGAFIYQEGNKPIYQEFYHRYSTTMIEKLTASQGEQQLFQILSRMGERMVKALQGKQAVIPLSGGYDSRLLAVLLKEQKYNKVICYTFGREKTDEVKRAQQVAEKLGYPWYFIKNEKPLINDYFKSELFRSYYIYAAGYVSMFFMEQYFALLYLLDNKLVEKEAVFIPGFSGGFLAGSHLQGRFTEKSSKRKIIHEIFRNHYYLNPISFKDKQKILSRISKFVNKSANLPYSIFEDWDFKERQAKFIVNSARIYSFFGHTFQLPFWDQQLIDFFKTLPIELKNFKKLYCATVRNRFFQKYNLDLIEDISIKKRAYRIQDVKNYLRKFIPMTIKNIYVNKNDTSGYKQITGKMLEEMQRAGYNYRLPDRSYNSVIIQWYIFKLYQEMKV